MSTRRALAALALALSLAGCAVYPAGPVYGPRPVVVGGGYYAPPPPVFVRPPPPPVVVYPRPYYGRPYYGPPYGRAYGYRRW